jgi:L-rhamnose mutarotase
MKKKQKVIKLSVYVTIPENYEQSEDEVLDEVTDALSDAGIMAYVESEGEV